MMMKGMESNVMTTIECVGPRCLTCLMIRSMSGITDNVISKGKLTFVFKAFDVRDPRMCPSAMCPTANRCFPLALLKGSGSFI